MNEEITRLRKLAQDAYDAYREATRVADEATKAHVRLQLAAMGVEIGVTVVYAKRWSSDRKPTRWIVKDVTGRGRAIGIEVKRDGNRWIGRRDGEFDLSCISTVQP